MEVVSQDKAHREVPSHHPRGPGGYRQPLPQRAWRETAPGTVRLRVLHRGRFTGRTWCSGPPGSWWALLTARTGALYEQCNHMARKHGLSVLGSAVQPHLCPSALQVPGSIGSQAWPVVVAPRWLAGRARVTAHLDSIIRPGLGAASAASSVKQEAGLGGERRGRESASATEAGRRTSRSSLPPGAIWALRMTLRETPQSTSGVGLRRFCQSWALGGAAP